MKGVMTLYGWSWMVEIACVVFEGLVFLSARSVTAQRSPSRIKLKRIKKLN
jgi:hypothetical protein